MQRERGGLFAHFDLHSRISGPRKIGVRKVSVKRFRLIEVHVGLGMQGDAIEQGGFEPESKATPLGIILGRTVHVILETMVVRLKSSG